MTQDVDFPVAAKQALRNSQLRHNLRVATHTIRDKRAAAVAELDDWQELREAGRRIKDRAMRHLDVHLEALERSVTEETREDRHYQHLQNFPAAYVVSRYPPSTHLPYR